MDNGDWAALAGIVSAVLGTLTVWVRMWYATKKLDHDFRMEQLKSKTPEGGA